MKNDVTKTRKFYLIPLVILIISLVIFAYFQLSTNKTQTGSTKATVTDGVLETRIFEKIDKWDYSVEYTGGLNEFTDLVVKVDDHSYVFLMRLINGETNFISQYVFVDSQIDSNGEVYYIANDLTENELEMWIDYLKSSDTLSDEINMLLVNTLESIRNDK